MQISSVSFPQRHAGLFLGLILSLGMFFCLGSGSDPSSLWGVSQPYRSIGIEPFAEARGVHLGIDSGIDSNGHQPILTALAVGVFSFFGHGSDSLMLFSVVPYMLSIFLVALFISRRRGRIFGLIGGAWLAFQPTFLAWSSVPATVPLASCLAS